MDRHERDVVSLIEDLLRAIAMVNIDIDDGDSGQALAEMLGCDRRIVAIAVSTATMPIRMMSRRTAQRIGHTIARQD